VRHRLWRTSSPPARLPNLHDLNAQGEAWRSGQAGDRLAEAPPTSHELLPAAAREENLGSLTAAVLRPRDPCRANPAADPMSAIDAPG